MPKLLLRSCIMFAPIIVNMGRLGRALDWWLDGCWFEPHLSHCVVSLTFYPLLNTGSTQEDLSQHD